MKTTIEISPFLLEETKRYAKKNGLTFKSVLESSLRHFFKTQKESQNPFRLKNGSFKGKGLADGVTESNWAQIREMTYKERGHL